MSIIFAYSIPTPALVHIVAFFETPRPIPVRYMMYETTSVESKIYT